MLLRLWCLLSLFVNVTSYNYLNMDNYSSKFLDIPTTGIIKSEQQYPYIGFGCNAMNGDETYLITSSYNPYGYSNNIEYKCGKTIKYVEIMKYNFEYENYTDNLIIGQPNLEYPNAQGDLGSDNVITCGIDNTYNILYYIASNLFSCTSNYNYDTSIVRINLTDFSFIDRTKLIDIDNIDSFSPSSYYEYKYINAPTSSKTLNDGTIWISFGSIYTGVWRLNISSVVPNIVEQFQKTFQVKYEYENSMDDKINYYTEIMREIKKSFINKDTGLLYFLEDTGYRNAKLMEVNLTKPIGENNSKIIELDGMTYVSDIEIDYTNKKIYFVSGLLTSELYQYDYDFNKIPLSETCNVDFLKFPTEWGRITNIEVDYQSGFLYAIMSIRHGTNGIVRIQTKDLELQMYTHEIFGESKTYIYPSGNYTYFQSYINTNISALSLKHGKLLLSPNANNYHKKAALIYLSGCAEGRGYNGEICFPCQPGKYTNSIGGSCKMCDSGYSSNVIEATNCERCDTGKYSNGLNLVYCEDCPQGYFSKNEGSDNCIACVAGKFSITPASDDSENCLNCEQGRISDKGETACVICEIGKWAKNSIECIECSKGKYSSTYSIIADIECKLCTIGKYSNNTGLNNENQCISCEEGKIGLTEGSTSRGSCFSCESGKFQFSENECKECPIGWVSKKQGSGISDRGETACVICEIGKWAKNSIECIECSKGKYSSTYSIIADIECKLCTIGKYSNNTGLNNENQCISCEEGKIGLTEGSTSRGSCFSCESGKFQFSENECKECPLGWVSQKESKNCNLCDIGLFANVDNCIACSMGKYSATYNIISDTECKLCPIGKYSDIRGIISENDCINCQEGRIGLSEGVTTNSSCISCESGKYQYSSSKCLICPNGWVSKEQSTECSLCDIGLYADEYKISCLKCPTGRYNDLQGIFDVNDCKYCGAGKFSNLSGSTEPSFCIPCELGKYNTDIGLNNINLCKKCEAGKYNNNIQNTGQECQQCIPGKFSKENAIECDECPMGTYTEKLSEATLLFTVCLQCPPGTYNYLTGKHDIISCFDCPKGTWNSNQKSISEDDCVVCKSGLYSELKGSHTIESCKECIAGKYNENVGGSSSNDCKDCATGTYSLSGSSNCIHCLPGKFTSNMMSTQCEDCPVGRFSGELGSILCKQCTLDAEQNFEKTKCVCSSGTYTLNISNINCKACPTEFNCLKGDTLKSIKLKKNYWRHSDNTVETYKCKNIFACNGGEIFNSSNDLCNEGHEGPICDVCKQGWAKDDGVCLKCPENTGRTIGLTVVIPIVCTLIIVFLIKTANPSENKKEEVNGVVKIFMNYAQVFSLASSFQINWPTLIRYLFERAKEFSSPRVSFYSSDCAIGWSYYEKLIVYLALPIVYIFSVTCIIGIVSLLFCKKKKTKLKRFNSVIEREDFLKNSPSCCEFFIAWQKTAVVVGTFLSWPTIVEKTLEVMNCERIGDKYYLVKDVSIECYNSQHVIYLTIAYIALGLYGVGIPLTGFRLLYKHRFRLFDMQNRYDGSTPLSFLFLGYREKRWYYEFIIMGKKASLIIISVFLRNYPRYQIIAASLMVQISFFLHVFLRPYDVITSYGMICNKLESISLLSLVMTLSTGLFFGTINSGYELGTFEDVLIVILILSNGGITLYFLSYFFILTKKSISSHLKEFVQKKIKKDNLYCIFKCCSEKYIDNLIEWGDSVDVDNYGINLKNDIEKEIFANFFKQKQDKTEILNQKIDGIKKKRLSLKLDKLRTQIQVMEKERCWQTIKNNRLYNEVKKTAMISKISLDDSSIKDLDDIFHLYIDHGIEYNKRMNYLYMNELKGMINKKNSNDSMTHIEEKNEIIVPENSISINNDSVISGSENTDSEISGSENTAVFVNDDKQIIDIFEIVI